MMAVFYVVYDFRNPPNWLKQFQASAGADWIQWCIKRGGHSIKYWTVSQWCANVEWRWHSIGTQFEASRHLLNRIDSQKKRLPISVLICQVITLNLTRRSCYDPAPSIDWLGRCMKEEGSVAVQERIPVRRVKNGIDNKRFIRWDSTVVWKPTPTHGGAYIDIMVSYFLNESFKAGVYWKVLFKNCSMRILLAISMLILTLMLNIQIYCYQNIHLDLMLGFKGQQRWQLNARVILPTVLS